MSNTAEIPKCFESANGQFVIQMAHRYAMGRMTAAPSIVTGWLRAHWGFVNHSTKKSIVQETIEELARPRLTSGRHPIGDQCDAETWKEFADWAYMTLPEESREEIYASLMVYRRAWPLSVYPRLRDTGHGDPEDDGCHDSHS